MGACNKGDITMHKAILWTRRRLRRMRKTVIKKLNLTKESRYKHLITTIDNHRCYRIMEIGTYDGKHSMEMIETAKQHWPPEKIEYYGFDLFEDANKQTLQIERALSKIPPSYDMVRKKLEETGAIIKIFKGNTLNVLPDLVKILPKMDFIFIDGGHSIETVENDWKYSKELMHDNTIVIFDDYWNMKDSGCNKVIDSLDKQKFFVEILQPTDVFKKEWGTLKINLVKVMKKCQT